MNLDDSSTNGGKKSRHILFLEDDLDTLILITTFLEMYGYRVTAVETLTEAQEAIQKEDFGLLLFDGFGLELCQQIRQSDPHTPIIFLSGRAFQTDIEKGIQAGAQAYLIKPIDLEVLEKTLFRFLS
jgi:DNA-binding response OmpR family regulator